MTVTTVATIVIKVLTQLSLFLKKKKILIATVIVICKLFGSFFQETSNMLIYQTNNHTI